MHIGSLHFLPVRPGSPGGITAYAIACFATILVAAATFPVHEIMGNANVVMLFLLEVFLCALWLGQKPSLLAALLAVFLFDFFFVPPKYALLTNSLKYSVMLVVMLLIALLTSQLAARLLTQNQMARELAGAVDAQQVEAIASRYPDDAATRSLLEIARQRLHYAELAHTHHVQMESERLRNSILSSLSHDLRTPLTVLVGLTETLHLQGKTLSTAQQDMVDAVHDQSVRLADMVTKLLDLARLSAGKVKLNKEWQSLLDVTGTALDLLGPALEEHPINIQIPIDFPLLEFDAVLMERVIGNLLDNAAKHTPAGTPIEISAHVNGAQAEIYICDQGQGFPSGIQPDMTRLGLAICTAILHAHGSNLHVGHQRNGGTCACFSLPLGSPPTMDEEPEGEFA